MENVRCQIWPGPVEGYGDAEYFQLEDSSAIAGLGGLVLSALTSLALVYHHKAQTLGSKVASIVLGASTLATYATAVHRIVVYSDLKMQARMERVGRPAEELSPRCQIWPGPVEGYGVAEYSRLADLSNWAIFSGVALLPLGCLCAYYHTKTQTLGWKLGCLGLTTSSVAIAATATHRTSVYRGLCREALEEEGRRMAERLLQGRERLREQRERLDRLELGREILLAHRRGLLGLADQQLERLDGIEELIRRPELALEPLLRERVPQLEALYQLDSFSGSSNSAVSSLTDLALEATLDNLESLQPGEWLPHDMADQAVEIALLKGLDTFRAVLPHVKVEKLDLSVLGARVDDQLLAEIAKTQPKLRELKLEGAALTNRGLHPLKQLRNLTVKECGRVTAEMLWSLPRALEQLHMEKCPRLRADEVGTSIGRVFGIKSLRRFSEIRSFRVEGCPGDWSRAVQDLPRKKIQHLKVDSVAAGWLQGCSRLESLEVEKAAVFEGKMPCLRRLVIGKELQQSEVEGVIAHLSVLESLEVGGKIPGGQSLKRVLERPTLRELRLLGGVSEGPLISVLREHGQNLSSLGLQIPLGTDWNEFLDCLRTPSQLEKLWLGGAVGMYSDGGDAHLSQLVGLLSHLGHLEIDYGPFSLSVNGALEVLQSRKWEDCHLAVDDGLLMELGVSSQRSGLFQQKEIPMFVWGEEALRVGAKGRRRLPLAMTVGQDDQISEAVDHLEELDGQLFFETMGVTLSHGFDSSTGYPKLLAITGRMPRLNWLVIDADIPTPKGLISQLPDVARVDMTGYCFPMLSEALESPGNIQTLGVNADIKVSEWRSLLEKVGDHSSLPHIECDLDEPAIAALRAEFPGLSMTG